MHQVPSLGQRQFKQAAVQVVLTLLCEAFQLCPLQNCISQAYRKGNEVLNRFLFEKSWDEFVCW